MDEVDSFADLDLNEEDIEDLTHVGVTPHVRVSGYVSIVFVSLVYYVWFNGGVGGGLVTPIYCRFVKDLCGGAIRSSSRGASGTHFCCKAADMCTIQSHQHQKVAIQEGTIYLQGPRLGQARLEPSLNINQLPVEIPLTELLEMQKPCEVMIAYFSGIACELKEEKPRSGASDISSPGLWTPIDLVQLDLMEEASRLMKSPSKLKMGPFLAEMTASAQLGGPKLEALSVIQLDNVGKPMSDEQNVFLITSGWNNLVTNVSKIKERMDTHNEGDTAFRETLFRNYKEQLN
eukprot:scaffold119214_cov44-Attheya_sp.AAC.1